MGTVRMERERIGSERQERTGRERTVAQTKTSGWDRQEWKQLKRMRDKRTGEAGTDIAP
jgi:hypothetical protein